jgi:uncharacterized pyridoxal phosphate-containing UPF0001 family protein
MNRRDELEANLAEVEARLAKACAAAGRPRDDVTLVAVTKTFPASDVRILAELGVNDVAENRDQEARRKAAECSPPGLRWHFVGQLQRNKARSVVRYADVVHSVDRPELIAALGEEAAKRRDTPLDILLQVSLDTPEGVRSVIPITLDLREVQDLPEHARHSATQTPGASPVTPAIPTRSAPSAGQPTPGNGAANALEAGAPVGPRGGAEPADVLSLAAEIAREPALRLRGVMAVAPRDADPDDAFARLATVAADLREAHPEARWISAGMSADLESAIRHGATHVRVGSALLGNRWRRHGTVAG